jgi:hypothetical protein
MTVEIFEGTPEGLKARLEAIIALPKTINFVFPSAQRGKYVIMFT